MTLAILTLTSGMPVVGFSSDVWMPKYSMPYSSGKYLEVTR